MTDAPADRPVFAPHQVAAKPVYENTEGIRARFSLHPFFGFVERPRQVVRGGEAPLWTNDYGFHVCEPGQRYPTSELPADAYVIGLFGGSVAANLFDDARGDLAARAKEVLGLSGRDVVVLSFAQSAFHQPQQSHVLAHFMALGQRFDAVILLDGFNEIRAARANLLTGVAPECPPWGLLSGLLEFARASALDGPAAVRLGEILMLRGRLAAERGGALAALNAIQTKIWEKRLTELLAQEAAEPPRKDDFFYAAPLIEAFPLDEQNADDPRGRAMLEDLAARWAGASRVMADLCAARGIRFLHALQPNQYDFDKELTADEKKYIVPGSFQARCVRESYPLLRKHGEALRRAGIAFFDLTSVFADVGDSVLRDPVCHFNEGGSRIIARRLADLLAETEAQEGRHGSTPF